MWKYINNSQIKEFLLSLFLINESDDKKHLKKLYAISNNLKSNYIIYKIKKKNGKYRYIYEPTPTLKHIQRQILNNILNNKKISKYAKAYHKNISLKDNALPHIGNKKILKLDIENFFDNIKFWNIYKSCFPIEYFPKEIGMLLTYLCTIDDHLPQGAPTSSYISNLVMKNFDEKLGYWCEERKINYTRYSDDLTFSGDFKVKEVIKKVNELLKPLDLKLNKDKIHVITSNKAQLVTGIVVNEKPQLPKKYRDKIRQEIYYIKKFGLENHLKYLKITDKDKYIMNLKGRILYVLQINSLDKEFQKYLTYINKSLN